jgi:hypothetical protein
VIPWSRSTNFSYFISLSREGEECIYALSFRLLDKRVPATVRVCGLDFPSTLFPSRSVMEYLEYLEYPTLPLNA